MEEKLKEDQKKIEKRTQQTLNAINKELEKFVNIGVNALNDLQKGFIFARRDYLSESQKKLFKGVIDEQARKAKEKLAREAEALNDEGDQSKEPTVPTLDELKERGGKVGVEYKVGTRKADFQKMVEEAEAKADAEQ